METILEFENIFFKWADGLEIRDVNLKINKGSFILITGPSGSGKSTLLRLASRLEVPNSGRILFENEDVSTIPPAILRRKISLIQQTPTVLEGTIRDNLLLPYSFGANKAADKPSDDTIIKKLAELSLDTPIDKLASSLSVGQKQRLCILRTLLLNPQVLLMDEPTSALDPESKSIVEQITEKLNREGTTILMVSHSDYKPSVPFIKLIVKNGLVGAEL